MVIDIKSNKNIETLVFGNNLSDSSILHKIIEQVKNKKISGPIEDTSYPFVISEKIEISLSEKEKQNIFNLFKKEKMVNKKTYVIELKTNKTPLLKKLIAKYADKNIILKNFSTIEIEHVSNFSNVYLKIILSEFAKKEEGKIKDYCMDSVDEHIDRIVNGGGKKKSKTKAKSNTPSKK